MNIYTIGLVTGALGLVAMAVLGFSHGGHDGGHGGHGHGGHGHDVGHGHGHDAAHHGNHGGHAGAAGWLLTLLAPRVWFTVLMGFGATGLAFSSLPGVARVPIAIGGGVLLELLLAAPLSRFVLRFASKPALTLESCLMDEVLAVAGFDASGHGLVSAELDGQVVQVLATLRPDDVARGVRIRIGDRLRVEEVDARQRFIVSPLSS